MSLETVVEDIRKTAQQRADEILAEADEEADRIVADAEAEAEAIVAEAEEDVERQIVREREQRRSSATLEAKQARLEARREELAAVREAVEAALADLEGETRETLTRALLEDAAAEFEGAGPVRVYGAEGDENLLESIIEDYDDLENAGTVDCLGGVVAESEASRLRVNNTFDSVLDTVWDEELREISDRLFER